MTQEWVLTCSSKNTIPEQPRTSFLLSHDKPLNSTIASLFAFRPCLLEANGDRKKNNLRVKFHQCQAFLPPTFLLTSTRCCTFVLHILIPPVFPEHCYVSGLFLVFGKYSSEQCRNLCFLKCALYRLVLAARSAMMNQTLALAPRALSQRSVARGPLWLCAVCLLGISLLNCELFLHFHLSEHLRKDGMSTSRERVYV